MTSQPSNVVQFNGFNHTVSVGKRVIHVGGQLPPLRDREKLVRYTSSLCPNCFRVLPAVIIERESALFIRRMCPEHGEIEEIYFASSEMAKRFEKYTYEGDGVDQPYTTANSPCPFNCGLCPLHKTRTALLNIVLTNRCDLSCWYCFYYAEKAGYVYEPTIDDVIKMVEALSKQKNIAVAIQLTGGEPTLREDLIEIIRTIKGMGVTHIQLNTHGIRFADLYLKDPKKALEYTRNLRAAGINTVYLSFDGVSPATNPKNHWEIPYALEVFRGGGMTSVVFVPTVIKSVNDGELGDIVRIAAYNMDIVRGVNFQPVSLVGMMRKQERAKFRITIPEVIKLIEEQTEGEIPDTAWFPVGAAVPIARFIKILGASKRAEFTTNSMCGAATYVYVKRESDDVRFIPITDFIDANGLLDYLEKKYESLTDKPRLLARLLGLASITAILNKYVLWNRVPDEIKAELKNILLEIFIRRNYSALGRFHYKFLFLGMMHFMDEWNYDVGRVMRCAVHYALPDGRIIPFCAFNIINDIYRDTPQKTYGIPIEEYMKRYGEKSIYDHKYVRTKELIEKMAKGEIYQRFYQPVLNRVRKK
ncbi:MAG: radical SAM protein [Ignisphaera sp.]|nr:radical SAM protein [Ignisphaera sp.]MCX8168143.1 radical SAM protein [Ignisphaera sp.]MDW8085217.1 radical SAM protein [Ignisphaera sp.]